MVVYVGSSGGCVTLSGMSTKVVIGPRGRIVVPAALRRELGLAPGDVLAARVEEGRIVLEPRSAVLARIRQRLSVVPEDVSLVDELVTERRSEARRESSR
jgi:AbrB family looped-hinge helix DNA binding protein